MAGNPSTGSPGPARSGGERRPDPGGPPKELHPPSDAVYLRAMERTTPPGQRTPTLSPRALLEFRPWMLALWVFLACALGIAVMEQFRDAASMWAQVTPQDAPANR